MFFFKTRKKKHSDECIFKTEKKKKNSYVENRRSTFSKFKQNDATLRVSKWKMLIEILFSKY